MTYAEKIKELHSRSKVLMAEYALLARDINKCLRKGTPVEQEMIRLQENKRRQFTQAMNQHNGLVSAVTRHQRKFTDTYDENDLPPF
jgi:hypothetical protein